MTFRRVLVWIFFAACFACGWMAMSNLIDRVRVVMETGHAE